MNNKKALVVVAHCDDAVLWMGGFIHHFKDWNWNIFSLCNSNIPDKINSFNDSCKYLSINKYNTLNYLDYQSDGVFSKNKKTGMISELSKLINENYDLVFTHSRQTWNEYGHHDNHEETEKITTEIAKGRSIPCVYFSYRPIYLGKKTLNGKNISTMADPCVPGYFFQLNYEELKFKLELISKFPKEIGNLSPIGYPCVSPEAFESDNDLSLLHK
jgi:LmbE family N-acetylglucosaminyl deacetylase